MLKYRQIYAVYRGEQNLGDGTAEQLAKQLNIKVSTVRLLASPASNRRNKTGNRLSIIKLGKEMLEEGKNK